MDTTSRHPFAGSIHRLLFVVGVVLVMMSIAPTVRADSDDERARAHFLSGRSYFDQARYEDSLREFELGFRLSGRSQFLLNIASCLERLGRWSEAADRIDAYLTQEPATPDRRTLEERARSFRERARVDAAAAARASAATSETTTEPTSDAVDVVAPPVESPRRGLGTLGIVGLSTAGVGVASLGTALATGLASRARYDDLTALCGPERVCPASAEDDLNQGHALARASTATLFIGAALAAGGAVLFGLDLRKRHAHEDDTVSVGIAPGPGQAGLSVVGTF